jgi:predicted acyl esterase
MSGRTASAILAVSRREEPCVTLPGPLKEDLEMTGPSALYFFAALSTDDANWFINLWDVAPDGSRALVTKGWLKASHRGLDEKEVITLPALPAASQEASHQT